MAALRISQKGAAGYFAEDGPRALPVLHWLATAYAYLWLLTDEPPSDLHEPAGPVELGLETTGSPNAGTALLRLVYSLPALLVMAVLSAIGFALWIVGAVGVLLVRRVPHVIADFLEMTVRYQFRLVAYHLSLVDRYPSTEKAVAEPHLPLSSEL